MPASPAIGEIHQHRSAKIGARSLAIAAVNCHAQSSKSNAIKTTIRRLNHAPLANLSNATTRAAVAGSSHHGRGRGSERGSGWRRSWTSGSQVQPCWDMGIRIETPVPCDMTGRENCQWRLQENTMSFIFIISLPS